MSDLIILNKPQGITSFSAVSQIKRTLGIKRVGHTGTLDPMATGVLPILTGRASRLSSMLLDSDKRYTATLLLGITTDTYDVTGSVLARCDAKVSEEDFKKACNKFSGRQMQLPPMYSAIKKNGVRLYKLAREGKEIEREAREIEIKEISLLEAISSREFKIDVLCSKGTYIRSLVHDIGEALGVGATLSALCRSEAAGFKIEDAVSLEDFKAEPKKYLLSPERCVMHLGEISVTFPQATRFLNGGELSLERLKGLKVLEDGERLRVKLGGELLGIGVVDLNAAAVKIGCIIKED